MFYIQKMLLGLASPILIILFLLFLSAYLKKWSLVFFASFILFIVSTPVISIQLIKAIESGNQQVLPQKSDDRQAVVVLSGYLSIIDTPQGKQFQWGSADRFFKGIELAIRNSSNFLIFTNEQLPWNTDTPNIGMFLIKQSEMLGITKNRILITTPVQNTRDEALAVAKLGKEKGFNRVILVTSAFHMQRAKLLFEAEGLIVSSYPTDYRADARRLNFLDFIPSANGLANSEFFIRELLGRLYYRLVYSLSSPK
jgi:uncharacterized SAM-binding protein YcdF (DUF218 family)